LIVTEKKSTKSLKIFNPENKKNKKFKLQKREEPIVVPTQVKWLTMSLSESEQNRAEPWNDLEQPTTTH